MKNNSLFKYLLPILSGVLLNLSWPPIGVLGIIFFALVPLLYFFYLQYQEKRNKKYVIGTIAGFLIFIISWQVVLVRWLIGLSGGTVGIGLLFTFSLMIIIFLPFILFFRKLSIVYGFMLFAFNWMLWEYLIQIIPFSIPFFMLGNSLGQHPHWIQHYQFIGIEGGSLWILALNILILFAYIFKNNRKRLLKNGVAFAMLLILPIIISFLLLNKKEADLPPINIALINADFESYDEQKPIASEKIAEKLWQQSKSINEHTQLLVWPEGMLYNLGWANIKATNPTRDFIAEKLKAFPNLMICGGGNIYSYQGTENDDPYNILTPDGRGYYQMHNIAAVFTNQMFSYTSKEKFVPFQERIPYAQVFNIFAKFINNVGNRSKYSPIESLSTSYTLPNTEVNFSPSVCYESLYPLFMAERAKDNQFIVLIANEYWNTAQAGLDQYLYSNIAMAIQSGIPIIRSANGGESGLITAKGEMLQFQNKNISGLIQIELNHYKTNETIYTFIKGWFYILSLIGLLLLIIKSIIQPNKASFLSN